MAKLQRQIYFMYKYCYKNVGSAKVFQKIISSDATDIELQIADFNIIFKAY